MVSLSGPERASTGIAGLDEVLNGGLTRERMYLIEGAPGSGKTTLALQFLLAGVAAGETCMYLTLSETAEELRTSAATHGWSLDQLTLTELSTGASTEAMQTQSVLHSSELELGETIGRIIEHIRAARPSRVVFDSLSEFRLLAQADLRFRREILALKHFLSSCRSTVLMLDDRSSDMADLQLHSIAHGVIRLEQVAAEYGVERRRLRVLKFRGSPYQGGYHDLNLVTGGLEVFPRLVAAEHHRVFDGRLISTGLPPFDALLGGGLLPGTNLLFRGPSGVGKTTMAMHCTLAAARQDLKASFYLFDEGTPTLLTRTQALGMDPQPLLDGGQLSVTQINPAMMSPGEFATRVRHAVEDGCRVVVIDSLEAYVQSMPGQHFLALHMHELLTYLNQQGVITLVVLGQRGTLSDGRNDVDLSYLSDALVEFRLFEARGEIRTAVSVLKSRGLAHERWIREFRINRDGLAVGEALPDLQGIFSGVPSYGGKNLLASSEHHADGR